MNEIINERIQRLAKKAYYIAEGNSKNDLDERIRTLLLKSLEPTFEEFAELVIKDVADRCFPDDDFKYINILNQYGIV